MNLYLLTISCCLANSVKTDLGFSLAQNSHFRFSSPLCWALLICQFHQSLACQVSLSLVFWVKVESQSFLLRTWWRPWLLLFGFQVSRCILPWLAGRGWVLLALSSIFELPFPVFLFAVFRTDIHQWCLCLRWYLAQLWFQCCLWRWCRSFECLDLSLCGSWGGGWNIHHPICHWNRISGQFPCDLTLGGLFHCACLVFGNFSFLTDPILFGSLLNNELSFCGRYPFFSCSLLWQTFAWWFC